MRDLRFIHDESGQSVPAEFKNLVKKFLQQGQKFNQQLEKQRTNKADCEAYLQKCKKSKNTQNWKIFKSYFLAFTNYECPICGMDIDQNADIEHYRPQKMYWWLIFDFTNYSILCKKCNGAACKGSQFPLFKRGKKVTFENRHDIGKEQPLLFNPTTDNPTDLFKVDKKKNIQSTGKYGLWIEPKSQQKQSYAFRKAVQTIHTFNLNAQRIYQTGFDRSRGRQLTERYYMVERLLKARDAYIKDKSIANKQIVKQEIENLKDRGHLTLVKMVMGI